MRADESTAESRRKREPYLCFLLRCRLEEDTGQPAWRFTVQQVGKGAPRRTFASFSDVTAYVQAELVRCEALARREAVVWEPSQEGGDTMNLSKKQLVLAVVVMASLLALTGSASAQQPVEKDKPAGDASSWSALDKVPALLKTLDNAGFGTEEGSVDFWDLVMDTCEGRVPDTLANNPWPNAYIAMKFKPHEGVPTPPVDVWWQLREDEAIVLVGQTPPPAAYFSYQTFVAAYPGAPGRIGAAMGDTINSGTIHTIGPDHVRRPVVIIITGHRETERRVRAALLKAGYPDAVINVETLASAFAPLGVSRDGKEGSWFGWVHRVAVPQDKKELEEYIQNPTYKVFRVTPKDPATGQVGMDPVFAPDPEPAPILRVRGTGHTEMDLYPALKRLRQAIKEKYADYNYKELDTHVWSLVTRLDGREVIAEKPYVGIQRNYQLLGAGRDTNYLATYPNFMLRQGTDEFVIAFGVNHQKTNKVTYSSVSIYADKDRWFGPKDGTMLSPEFGDSASQYLPSDPDADKLYAIKVARNCHGEKYCMEVKQPDWKDKNGDPYKQNPQCILGDFDNPTQNLRPWNLDEQEMFFIFRSYMEPATKVGPDDNELLYDQAIYFGPGDFWQAAK